MNRLSQSTMMKMMGVPSFGPTGNINSNNITSVGQGLKKIFRPQPEYPRIFRSDEGGDFGRQKRGGNSGIIGRAKCPCDLLDLEILLGIFGGQTNSSGSGGDTFESNYSGTLFDGHTYNFNLLDFFEQRGDEDGNYPTDGNTWRRRRACLRFVCRCVSGGGISQKVFGGPTTYDRDIWNEILFPDFGSENASGNYLYIVDFYGYERKKRKGPPPITTIWQSDDTFFDIYKFSITRG
jgi:hypothetical protein